MGVARAELPPRAITSYRASATPAYLVPDADESGEVVRVDPPIPGQRIVGRAVVAGTEDQ
jgi:hypothetical protein